MAFEVRDALRAKVIETLISTFPGAQKVVGGVAFHSDVVDEETGMLFPVELKVTVKNTKDTARSKAYDLDAEVEKAATRPGRRVADPAKKAEREAAKEAWGNAYSDYAFHSFYLDSGPSDFTSLAERMEVYSSSMLSK